MGLELIYHCGLRVGEAVRVEVRDLHESRTDHPRLHVRCGKGGGDRFVPKAEVFARIHSAVDQAPSLC